MIQYGRSHAGQHLPIKASPVASTGIASSAHGFLVTIEYTSAPMANPLPSMWSRRFVGWLCIFRYTG